MTISNSKSATQALWDTAVRRAKDPMTPLAISHEVSLIDVLINHDMGLDNDLVLRHRQVPPFASWWTSFLVTNRSVEQAFKFFAPIAEPRDIGHRLASKWRTQIDGRPTGKEAKYLGSLRVGYSMWQALFQSPWPTLDDVLDHLEKKDDRAKPVPRNAKEYTLIAPDDYGARIDPFLPLALAEIAAMAWGAIWVLGAADFTPDRFGVRFGDTTVGKLRRIIGRIFEESSGVNLNLDLYNEKCKGRNYLQLWSEWLHAIRPYRERHQRRIERTLKYRDGSQHEAVSSVGREYYTYRPQARDALIDAFDGDTGLADAHVDTAQSIVNHPDWRLQFFIKMSEATPVKSVDGLLTDTLHGKWHQGIFRR